MQQSELLKSPQKIDEDPKYGQVNDNNLPELQNRRRTGGHVSVPAKAPQKNNFYSQRNSENTEQQLMVSNKTSPGINLQQDAKQIMVNSRNDDKFVT